MNWVQRKRKLKIIGQYVPLTLHLILLILVGGLIYFRIISKDANDTSSFTELIRLMGKTAFWLILFALAFSFLSAFGAFVYFLIRKAKHQNPLKIKFEQTAKGGLLIKAEAEKLHRPLLGSICSRLLYDDGLMTPKLPLAGNLSRSLFSFSHGIKGAQAIKLPDIKEYDLKGYFIYFQDWLHLFSFPIFYPYSGHFFESPQKILTTIKEVVPQRADKDENKTTDSLPIPGDYVDYKDFEGGDDIRRIVWQIFAKSGDLVVRIPEKRDFWASKLDLYASFYSDKESGLLGQSFYAEMLNHYKNCVWSVIQTFLDHNIPLKFLLDQPYQSDAEAELSDELKRMVSNASWQRNTGLEDYLPARLNGVFCISTFNEINEIENLLEGMSRNSVVYFVPLTKTFKASLALGLLRQIFFRTENNDRLKRLRTQWAFSPLRGQLNRKENQILSLLEDAEIKYAVLG